MTDLQIAIDSAIGTFLALMLTEALVKPIASRLGKWLLHRLDHLLPAIPDWLSGHSDDEVR